ncbi:hypothetical protein ALC56_13033, partial [Trachymyrmex septentrionalis]
TDDDLQTYRSILLTSNAHQCGHSPSNQVVDNKGYKYKNIIASLMSGRKVGQFNRGYHYILTVIDMLSKHALAEPFKVKNWNEVTKAIAKIIREDRRCLKNLHTDRGKEFYNSDMQKL